MVPVKDLTTSLRQRIQRLFGSQFIIKWVCGYDIGYIKADPFRMEEIVVDLATRARNKVPPSGEVTFEWAYVHVEDPVHGDGALCPGPYVMLEITCRRSVFAGAWIFQPAASDIVGNFCVPCDMTQLDSKIRALGGQMCEYNEPGRAFTVRAFFPSAGSAVESSDFTVSTATKLQILLVEDEAFVRDVACEYLELEGYAVLSARTPKEAMQLFERNGPVHLLLTDVVMPGMNGRELSKTLTAAYPSLKTIYMSGYSDHSALQFEGEDAKRPFIQKPFTLESLVGLVKAVIGAPSA